MQALTWSKETFKDVASQFIFSQAHRWLLEGATVEDILKNETENLLRSACNVVNQSTSQTSNLMEQSRMEASAELVKILSSRL